MADWQGQILKNELLDFWFSPPMNKHWFNATPQLDQQIRNRFEALWESAQRGEKDHWKDTAEGCLALCIVLDQLPLNMFRGSAKAFSTEAQSIQVARCAINEGLDEQIAAERVAFLYMPLMHSETLQDQDLSVAMFEKAGLKDNLRFAKHHRELIREFGRFPHRNAILGRESTQQEVAYLNSKRAFTG